MFTTVIKKLSFSLERYFKLNRCCKILLKPNAFKYIIATLACIGFITNSPILFGYSLISDKIKGRTLYFMHLNNFGEQQSFGVLMVIDAVVIDVLVFVCVLFINWLLVLSIREHSKRMQRSFGRRSRNDRSSAAVSDAAASTNAECFVEDIDEESSSNVIITYMNNDDCELNNNESTEHYQQPQQLDQDPEQLEQLDPLERPVEIQLDQSTRESARTRKKIEIQSSIQSTSKMIQITSVVYLFGHLLYSVAGILVQLQYFETFANVIFRLLGHDITIDFVSSLSCLFLYISFGANFFVYCFFNELFYSLICEKIRLLVGGDRFVLLEI
jgi:hypothetical protein